MAREAKKDPSELTVEEKLKALYQLQTMLSEIDKIKTLRGELPLEVQDLEDEVAGLSTRIEKIKADIEELKSNIATKKIEIETAKTSVEKYKAQQDNVRNNREYDVLTKEIEFQSLEIELCEKRIKEYIAAEKAKSEEIEHSNQDLDERKKDLVAVNRFGQVDPDSNYCFGEGGAGTYSDGKLYTRSVKRGNVYEVLSRLVDAGADNSIMIDAHPDSLCLWLEDPRIFRRFQTKGFIQGKTVTRFQRDGCTFRAIGFIG